ncbi:lipopolysaccharide biosynthesis protein [Photobacterium leiognathi]|uniref:lipopolysaccharide biosynthesis protein n=1 Tax=Photobacterium leiognathi TaxID=553611 RepID=UPI0029822470|nr:hypothetical protein [Photobacterium leiognathi]
MKNKIKTHLVLSVLYTFITGMLAFYINRVFYEYLGAESLGLLKLFTNILAYLNLAEMGLGTISAALLYKPLHENNYQIISNIIYTISSLYKKIALFVLIIGIGFNFLLPQIIDNTNYTVMIYWTIYVIAISITYYYARYPILLTADQKYGYVQTLKNCIKIGMQVSQVFAIVYYNSFLIFIILILISNVFEWVFYLIYMKGKYNYLKTTIPRKDKRVIKKTRQMIVHQMAGVLVFNTDYIILAKYVSLSTVAVYSSYIMITQFMMLFINNIIQVIRPKFGNFYAKSERGVIVESVYYLFAVNMFLATFIVSVLYFALPLIIKFWMGDDFIISKTTLILLLVNVYIEISRKTIDMVKVVSGYFKDIHLPIIEGFLNLVMSLVLVKFYGLNGVILGTIISNVIIVVIAKPYFIFRDVLKSSFYDYMIKCLFYVLLTSVVVISLSFLFEFIAQYNDLIQLLLYIILSAVLSIILFCFDKTFISICLQMKKRLYLI